MVVILPSSEFKRFACIRRIRCTEYNNAFPSYRLWYLEFMMWRDMHFFLKRASGFMWFFFPIFVKRDRVQYEMEL